MKASCASRAVLKASARPSHAVVAAPAKKFNVWQPNNNKMFETFSFLPPLDDKQVAKQIDYIVSNAWVPCLEFADSKIAYIADTNTARMGNCTASYYDNRYWTMWKLPMFGCTDASQVQKEISACTKAFPNSYVRMAAFDSIRQVQVASFLVQRPKTATDWSPVDKRSVIG